MFSVVGCKHRPTFCHRVCKPNVHTISHCYCADIQCNHAYRILTARTSRREKVIRVSFEPIQSRVDHLAIYTMLCCCTTEPDATPSITPVHPAHIPTTLITHRSQVKRRVRDIIPALFFVTFVAGMVAIGVAAFTLGDPNRIKYGIDSYGNVCGSLNTWNGTAGPDLVTRRHLYLLDPLSAVSLSALRGARTVCLDACPQEACDAVPCSGGPGDYVYVWHGGAPSHPDTPMHCRCSYYRASPTFDTLQPPPDDWSTSYFAALSTATSSNCSRLLASEQTGVAWQQLALRVLGTPAAATCGQALQLQSATPSLGPCHPVLLPTQPYANRWVERGVLGKKKGPPLRVHSSKSQNTVPNVHQLYGSSYG